MYGSKLLNSVVVAVMLAFSSAANAAVYDFGSLLASDWSGAPTSATFATLQANDTGNGVWAFRLDVNSTLFATFGTGSFISTLKFDFSPDPVGTPVSTFVASNGITSADLKTVNGDSSRGVGFDFGTDFGKKDANRLVENEYVEWTVSGLGTSNLTNMYVHVQGIDGGYSAKYTPVTPVPEPETYAMLLAGLGLIGFSARRKA